MPLDRVRLSNAISKREFHSRLRAWLTGTAEEIIGAPDVD
jgi:hypothetical protein